jgi:hypothetical protein
MARQDGARRVWPWVTAVIAGLLTTSGAGPGTGTAGWLIIAGAITMIVRNVRCNHTARRAAQVGQARQAASPARSGQRSQVPPRQRRRSFAARDLRQLIRLLR